MRIRPFEPADKEPVIALWHACGLTRPWNDPAADIDLARATAGTALLVALDEESGAVIGSAMTGFDGHRGWLYYLAADPARRGEGVGRALTEACEAHLLDLGCPKVELIVRLENTAVQSFYEAIGYREERRRLYSKWLIDPPSVQDEPSARALPTIDVTITWLEMLEPPRRPARPVPMADKPVNVIRLIDPPVDYYRFIHHTVGDPWLWWTRRAMSNEELADIIKDEAVEIYLLQLGGAPAGFIELDFRRTPDVANINFFGLMPWCIGRGFGPYLLDWGIRCAWERDPAPRRLTLDTCTHDHPKALAGYQKAGFQVYDRTSETIPDPRARGFIPPETEVMSNVPPYPA
ncbi:GNAT family acetyltransferase [Marivibrio halodurans]|uniref:GNAT family acetyltransferase n=1 Tax=Marivibrio halodurans TaxID=2039722 RepID=A0A8J7RYN5_9PROT|nr:GNAT family acetyltransferase [Marivibrio halodurans]MBP5856795.1 GNAT family acetyltransferase [Marivibrio halodurans]